MESSTEDKNDGRSRNKVVGMMSKVRADEDEGAGDGSGSSRYKVAVKR